MAYSIAGRFFLFCGVIIAYAPIIYLVFYLFKVNWYKTLTCALFYVFAFWVTKFLSHRLEVHSKGKVVVIATTDSQEGQQTKRTKSLLESTARNAGFTAIHLSEQQISESCNEFRKHDSTIREKRGDDALQRLISTNVAKDTEGTRLHAIILCDEGRNRLPKRGTILMDLAAAEVAIENKYRVIRLTQKTQASLDFNTEDYRYEQNSEAKAAMERQYNRTLHLAVEEAIWKATSQVNLEKRHTIEIELNGDDDFLSRAMEDALVNKRPKRVYRSGFAAWISEQFSWR